MTKYRRLEDLSNSHLFSHSSGDQKSNVTVSADCLLLRPLSLTCRQLPSCYVFMWLPLSLCVVCANLPFSKEHQPHWISAYLCDLVLPNYLFKHPISKYSHIQGPKGLGCQHVNVKGVGTHPAYNNPQAPHLTTCLISLRWFLP